MSPVPSAHLRSAPPPPAADAGKRTPGRKRRGLPLVFSILVHGSILFLCQFLLLPGWHREASPDAELNPISADVGGSGNGQSEADDELADTLMIQLRSPTKPHQLTKTQPVSTPIFHPKIITVQAPLVMPPIVIQQERKLEKVTPPDKPIISPPSRALAKAQPKRSNSSKSSTGGSKKIAAKSTAGNGGKAGSGFGAGKGKGNGTIDRKASYARQAALNYPSEARRLGQKGSVSVRILVSKSGRALQVEVTKSSGFSSLDESARRCAKSSTYTPAIKNGQAVDSWTTASFRFTRDS